MEQLLATPAGMSAPSPLTSSCSSAGRSSGEGLASPTAACLELGTVVLTGVAGRVVSGAGLISKNL